MFYNKFLVNRVLRHLWLLGTEQFILMKQEGIGIFIRFNFVSHESEDEFYEFNLGTVYLFYKFTSFLRFHGLDEKQK